MAHVAQMLTQEPIYKSSSIFFFKPILLSAHKLILLIYGDNSKEIHYECLERVILGALPCFQKIFQKYLQMDCGSMNK